MSAARHVGGCIQCREPIWMSDETYQVLKRNGHTFRCIWGHPQVFAQGATEADKLRQERDRLKQNAAYLEDRLRAERESREAAERRASAARGQVTKLKKRASNGVCPCCNRTFADLQRHMATKHAGFMAEEVAGQAGPTIQ